MKWHQRLSIAIASVILAAALATAARAQTSYQPIPNYTGIGAGQNLLNAVNGRFSGATATSPSLVQLTCVQLLATPEVDGQQYYCSNCQQTPSCTCGGSGAPVVGTRGAWSCGGAAVGSLGGDATGPSSANTVTTVLGGQTPASMSTTLSGGDVVGTLANPVVQSTHGLVAPIATHATSPVIIGANTTYVPCDASGGSVLLQYYTAAAGGGKGFTIKKIDSSSNGCFFEATNTGDTVDGNLVMELSTQWQSGQVYDSGVHKWSIGSGPASTALSGDVSGDATANRVNTVLGGLTPTYQTEVDPQFGTLGQPFVVTEVNGGPGGTSDTVTKPAAVQPGDLLIYWVAVDNSSLTVTPPDGTWSAINHGTTASSYSSASWQKVAGSSEPSSYTFGLSSTAFGTSGLIVIRGENQSFPIFEGSLFNSTSSTTSATVDTPAGSEPLTLNLILLASTANVPFTVTAPTSTTPIFLNTSNGIITGAWSYTTTPANATLTNNGTNALWMLQQINVSPAPYGPASALVNGQPAATLSGPTLTGATTFSGSITGTGTAPAVTNANVNNTFNVQAYGATAIGNNLEHDELGEQAAVDAACTNANPSTVVWPTPPSGGKYMNCAPIFVHCNNVKLLGPDYGSAQGNPLIEEDPFCPAGPAFVFQQYAMTGVTLGAPLITNSVNSASFTGATNPYYVNLNDASSVVMGLNGASTAEIQAYIELTTTGDGAIVWSSGRKATYLTSTSAHAIRVLGGKITGEMTVGGTLYTLTDNTTTLATGTLYLATLTFDGTNIRLMTNGVLVAVQAASGTITQPYWEVTAVGAQIADWPDGAQLTTPINGLIDGVQISKIVRHTTSSTTVGATIFTPCNCEPTNDSNTIVIASFDQNLEMLTQLQWNDGGTQSGWSYVRRPSNAGVLGVEMDGISVQGKKGAIGIIGQQFNGCHIRHSSFTGVTSGIYEFNNDFENTFDDLYVDALSGGYVDFVANSSGLQTLTGGINLVGGLAGLRVEDSSIIAQGVVVQEQAGMVWGYSIQGDTGTDYFACSGCGMDAELSDSSWLGGLQLDNLEVIAWTGGAISAIGTSPVVEVDGGSQNGTGVFTGVNFSPTGSSPEVFHVANSNVPGSLAVIGSRQSAGPVPWTDSPADVIVTNGANTVGLLASTTGGVSNVTPSVASCGTGASVAASGTSNAFVITVGSTNPTTSCAVSFGSAANFTNAPVCTAQDVTKGFTLEQSSLATSGVTLTAPSGISDMHGDTINVNCVGK